MLSEEKTQQRLTEQIQDDSLFKRSSKKLVGQDDHQQLTQDSLMRNTPLQPEAEQNFRLDPNYQDLKRTALEVNSAGSPRQNFMHLQQDFAPQTQDVDRLFSKYDNSVTLQNVWDPRARKNSHQVEYRNPVMVNRHPTRNFHDKRQSFFSPATGRRIGANKQLASPMGEVAHNFVGGDYMNQTKARVGTTFPLCRKPRDSVKSSFPEAGPLVNHSLANNGIYPDQGQQTHRIKRTPHDSLLSDTTKSSRAAGAHMAEMSACEQQAAALHQSLIEQNRLTSPQTVRHSKNGGQTRNALCMSDTVSNYESLNSHLLRGMQNSTQVAGNFRHFQQSIEGRYRPTEDTANSESTWLSLKAMPDTTPNSSRFDSMFHKSKDSNIRHRNQTSLLDEKVIEANESLLQPCGDIVNKLHKKIDRLEIRLANQQPESVTVVDDDKQRNASKKKADDIAFFQRTEEKLRSQVKIYDTVLTDFADVRVGLSSKHDASILARVQSGFKDTHRQYEQHLVKMHRSYQMQINAKDLHLKKMTEDYDKYRRENDLDAFFTQNMSDLTRAEILDRIGEFMKVPDWWSFDMEDPVLVQLAKVSGANDQLGVVKDDNDKILDRMHKEDKMLVEEVAKNISEVFQKKPQNPKSYAEEFTLEKNKLIETCSKLTGKTATDFWLTHFVKEKGQMATQTDALDQVMVKLECENSSLADRLKHMTTLSERLEQEVSKQVNQYKSQLQATEEETAAKENFEKKLHKAEKELLQITALTQEIEDWKARHKKAKSNVTEIDAQLKIEVQKLLEAAVAQDELQTQVDQLKEQVEEEKDKLKKEKERVRASALSNSFKNDNPYPEAEKWEPRVQTEIAKVSAPPILEIESALKKMLNFEQHDTITKKLNNLKKSLGMMEGAMDVTTDAGQPPSAPESPAKLPPPSRYGSVRSNIADKPPPEKPENKPKAKKAAPKLDLPKPAAAPKLETPKAAAPSKDSLKKKRLSSKKISAREDVKKPNKDPLPPKVEEESPNKIVEISMESQAKSIVSDQDSQKDKVVETKKQKLNKTTSSPPENKKKKVTISQPPAPTAKALGHPKPKDADPDPPVVIEVPEPQPTPEPEQKPVVTRAPFSQVQTPMSVGGMDNDSSVADGLRRGAPSPIVEAMYRNDTGAIQFRETPTEQEASTDNYGRQSPIRNAIEKQFKRQVTHEAVKQTTYMPPPSEQPPVKQTVNAKTKTIFQKSLNHQRGPISSQTYSDESANSGEEELSSRDASKEPVDSSHQLNKIETLDDETLTAMCGESSLPSIGQNQNAQPLNQAHFVQISENKRPSPAGGSPELFGQFMGTSVEQQLMRSLIQKQQSIHTALIVNTARPPVRDAGTQTDVELMLIVAADLFFTELNASIKALRHEETALCASLKVRNFEQLESLRKQAKQLIGRIKSKGYRGVQIEQKPGATLYPSPGEADGEIFVDIFEASKSALTGKNTGNFLPEKSWHFANDQVPKTANNRKMLNKDSRPFMLANMADAEPMSIVTNRLRQRFAVGGSPSPVVLKVNEGHNISLTPTPVQESRTLFGPRVSSPQFRGDQSN